MAEYESTTYINIRWTPRRRAIAYGSSIGFILMGLILWPMGMSPLSNVALFWFTGTVWAFGFSIAAFWSARRQADERRKGRSIVRLGTAKQWFAMPEDAS